MSQKNNKKKKIKLTFILLVHIPHVYIYMGYLGNSSPLFTNINKSQIYSCLSIAFCLCVVIYVLYAWTEANMVVVKSRL